MKILIVEDERPIANYIKRSCKKILGNKIESIIIVHHLDQASEYLLKEKPDLCLLDLYLHGEDGYDLLKEAASGSFHTIIISANTDRALEAFEYGVLDFIGKPFTEERLKTAFDRYFSKKTKRENESNKTKYLSLRKGNKNIIISIDNVIYFKAAGIYVEANLQNGQLEILDKTMDRLEQILPSNFIRVHRSYIIEISQIKSYSHIGGGKYQATLKNDKTIPLSRQKYKEIKELLK